MRTTNGSTSRTPTNLRGAYVRLAADERAQFGYRPVGYDSWGYSNASRFIRKMHSRLTVSIKNRQDKLSRIERTFSVGAPMRRASR